MLEYIEGKLVEKSATHAVIDCGGVGYFLNISLNTYSKMHDGENHKLLVHYVVRDDAHLLYGFYDKEERSIFRLLISVSGVGVNTARVILSTLTPVQVQEAISGEDVNLIKSVKGIGIKTAQRVILDLKDKVNKGLTTSNVRLSENSNNKNAALSALEILGFNKKQSNAVVEKILKNEPGLGIEELIKNALKIL